MEWLALPRLIAIAERGWTPEANKNFSDFQKRMSADTVMLNYGNYKYCKYYMLGTETGGSHNDKVMPFANTADKKYYYRIISGGTDATRVGRCIELLAEGSELIAANSGKGAKAGVLWTSPKLPKVLLTTTTNGGALKKTLPTLANMLWFAKHNLMVL